MLIRRRCADGSFEQSLEAIGPLVDSAFENEGDESKPDDHGTEVIKAPEGLEACSFNPQSCKAEWRPVTALSRHAAPRMYRVRTSCGREVVATGDHNFLSLHRGMLRLLRTTDLTPEHYLPLPRTIDLSRKDLTFLDLIDILGEVPGVEVHSRSLWDWLIENAGWPRLRRVLARHYEEPHDKRYAITHSRKWRGIPLSVLRDLLTALDLVLPEDLEMEIRFRHMPSRKRGLPRWLPVTDALLTFLGLMLAEGHCAANCLLFSAYEDEVRTEFVSCAIELGMIPSPKENSDLQISSLLWTSLVGVLVGRKSRDKHLPAFWPRLSKRQLATLIRAYVEGDGGVETNTLSMTTASCRLASELGYALLGFGLWGRLHRRFKRATNSRSAGDWYQTVALTGQSNLTGFASQIGFLTQRKNQALQAQLGRAENSNVDVVPIGGSNFTRLRTSSALSKGALSQQSGVSRATMILVEKDERRPTASMLSRLLDGIEHVGHRSSERDQLLESSRALLDARWTPVRSIEPVEYSHAHVYDLSVAENETFLAGHGGLFVHNTHTVARVIEQWNRPTLVISHNKTLAAQLYGEFRQFFPDNGVGYFISYYDYYQPEAYVPSTNTYIAKDASINDDIDRLRLQATSMLLEREDVLIVASVSCIYGLGTPEDWRGMRVDATAGERMRRSELLEHMVAIQYTRNDVSPERGTFRVRGDIVEVHPAYEDHLVRIELDDDVVSRISAVDPLTGQVLRRMDKLALYPAKHFVTPEPRLQAALAGIRAELRERLEVLRAENKLVEAQRLKQRTEYDLEMLGNIGTCPGVENYSRHLSGRQPGDRPGCLLDYFPLKPDGSPDYLLVIDESHVTVPQIGGMYEGDRSRKQVLVDFGFRLPSALDNRPLRFDEFETLTGPTLFVSATPADYEMRKSQGVFVEQIIRPTGLVDPELVIKPIEGQVDDLLEEIRQRVAVRERILVTTLTKRMAEDLTDYLTDAGVKVRYLHSDIDALERVEILRGLRLAEFDVLVGINLLREGLDLPEVSLVAILDADKEGFLRSERSLIQTAGRAARNAGGRVVLYADQVTDSMRRAIEEMNRRRVKQLAYNQEHGVTPRTITKSVEEIMRATAVADAMQGAQGDELGALMAAVGQEGPEALLARLEHEMLGAARELQFERAASLRDRIDEIRHTLAAARQMGLGGEV
ncbi:MAG TPA: excinuclease ABC subunit UvrB, partial [Candidatus Eisenbacteria bacterium]|nr:excinuclease ABC subunit UvrB [Candidatus Eisenbacteria bacterium]